MYFEKNFWVYLGKDMYQHICEDFEEYLKTVNFEVDHNYNGFSLVDFLLIKHFNIVKTSNGSYLNFKFNNIIEKVLFEQLFEYFGLKNYLFLINDSLFIEKNHNILGLNKTNFEKINIF